MNLVHCKIVDKQVVKTLAIYAVNFGLGLVILFQLRWLLKHLVTKKLVTRPTCLYIVNLPCSLKFCKRIISLFLLLILLQVIIVIELSRIQGIGCIGRLGKTSS